MVVLGQKLLYSGKSDLIHAKWLNWGKIFCIRARVVCSRAKVVVFTKSGCIREKEVVFGKSGCILEKVVVFGQKLM